MSIASTSLPRVRPPAIAAPEPIRRILVCQLRQIGDVLLITPSLELLAKRFPHAQVHVITEKKCAPMLENNPHIHTLWPFDKGGLLQDFRFFRKVAACGFDVVISFQQTPRCRAMVLASRAKIRLSFPPPWYLRPLFTHWEEPKPAYAGVYKAGLLAPLGITWTAERPRLYFSDSEREEAAATLASLGLAGTDFISVDVTHKHATRRWPGPHYAALLDKLADAFPAMRFFLPYGPGEKDEINAIRSLCRCAERIATPEAMLSLRAMAACIERAVLQLGNCSSPRHMAVAVGVPSITILGSTGHGWTYPSPEHAVIQAKEFIPMPCQHCNTNTCADGIPCLNKLTPDLVLPRIISHLQQYCTLRASP